MSIPDFSLDWPTSHRLWALPDSAWVMYQEWHDLLFAHWPVPIETLRPLVPVQLPLDTFDGVAWVGIVPFEIRNLRARFVPPIPGVADFPELNVRTYVTLDGKPGAYFFSLNVTNPIAVNAARALYHLLYYAAEMRITREDNTIRYECMRPDGEIPGGHFQADYASISSAFEARPGSLDYFLTERYCLYAVDSTGGVHRAEIHHAPWKLQPARMDIQRNTMAVAHGIQLPNNPPLLHFSATQCTIIWLPERVT